MAKVITITILLCGKKREQFVEKDTTLESALDNAKIDLNERTAVILNGKQLVAEDLVTILKDGDQIELQKMPNYDVVEAGDATELVKKMAELDEGWKPQGGICSLSNGHLLQAVIFE